MTAKRSKGRITAVLAFLFIFVLIAVYSCVRAPKPVITTREEAFTRIPVNSLSLRADDLSVSSFLQALDGSLVYYRKVPPIRKFFFGRFSLTACELVEAYEALKEYATNNPSWSDIEAYIDVHFDALKCTGYRSDGKLLFTGYYEPSVYGSLKQTKRFKYPLYSLPDDLIYVDLKSFKVKSSKKKLVGRLDGRIVRPYYTRHEIDFEKKLRGKGYELVWLDDLVDCFFIQVQGSAEILLPDGQKMSINYAGSNGHPYRSIGALLINEGIIPKDKMSMDAIYKYLHEHPFEIERILSHNPSYVFFRKVKDGPVGSLGVILTPCRSVAADPRFFPPGALSFVKICKTGDRSLCGNIGTVAFQRLVFIQDRGGAIKGPGRIDYYWGKGRGAGKIAGAFKPWGEFYLLVPKLDLLPDH